jgi:hypothetical protein
MSHMIGIASALFLDTQGARWEEFSREKENYRQRSGSATIQQRRFFRTGGSRS